MARSPFFWLAWLGLLAAVFFASLLVRDFIQYKPVRDQITTDRDNSVNIFFERHGYGFALRKHIDKEQLRHAVRQKQLRDDKADLLWFLRDLDPRTTERGLGLRADGTQISSK